MRIPIRIQFGSLILISSLIGLAVISITVWVTIHSFVLGLRASRLSLFASLKAAELASNLDIMETAASFVSSRVLIQSALMRYNAVGFANWTNAQSDLQAAIGGAGSLGQQLLLQSSIYGANASGPAGPYAVLNATANTAMGQIPLPYTYPNGTQVLLGADDSEYGYPPPLHPDLTFPDVPSGGYQVGSYVTYNGRIISPSQTLLLGPWQVNSTYSLVSLTLAIVNNTNATDVLGWLTTVLDAQLIYNVLNMEGLGTTGETLLIGPASNTNVFPTGTMVAAASGQTPEVGVRYVLPLYDTYRSRHPNHVLSSPNAAFNATQYPAIYHALSALKRNSSDSSGANLRATNEAGEEVSVGYAFVAQESLVNWIIFIEQSRKEVWQPINHLRDVILACLFATVGFMAVIAAPLAHFSSLPILRLQKATARSIEPPNAASRSSMDSLGSLHDGNADEDHEAILARKEGFRNPLKSWKRKRKESYRAHGEERRKRAFKIPGKVKERKYWIKDELSDLTMTFNEMSDELMLQYSRLEERVQQRTAELELSKKAAEAANESKTLFIANISHELKTPLNGILGMCAVCMQEDDPVRLKRSLGIIYKSGDLLLNLLTDLLTFSKNQVGQSLSLDEKEFRLRDISTQILAIFSTQAKDSQIDLRVEYEGVHNVFGDHVSLDRQENGPVGTGRLRDMVLWGDVHRILQVVINLVSNALKFTPHGGSVELTIRCLPDVPELNSRKTSFNSKQSRRQTLRQRSSDGTLAVTRMSTANAINVKDKPHALAYVSSSDRTASPPPGKYLYFEFEVKDTGPGIPESLQAKIFEPFVQGDLGLSKKYGGTGLGLSICSQLANLMRGHMGVRSTVGVGSVFIMKIPLRMTQLRADSSASSAVDQGEAISRSSSLEDIERVPLHGPLEYEEGQPTPAEKPLPGRPAVGGGNMSTDSQPRLIGLSQPFFTSSQPMESPGSQPAAMKQITAEATRGGKIRVLVAEDNKVNQEVVLRMLKLEDIYDVTVAKDGQEALDLVKESMRGDDCCKPFNLIFMDVQMPNVDGLTSTRLIREIGYQRPIVALTAFAEESNIKDCLDSGMNYFLSKPIRRPQLKKVLKEYCAPIPEENEDVTPPEERRGSAVNTTIVMVNGQPSTASTVVSTTSVSAANAGFYSQLTTAPTPNGDPRPVSPRHVE